MSTSLARWLCSLVHTHPLNSPQVPSSCVVIGKAAVRTTFHAFFLPPCRPRSAPFRVFGSVAALRRRPLTALVLWCGYVFAGETASSGIYILPVDFAGSKCVVRAYRCVRDRWRYRASRSARSEALEQAGQSLCLRLLAYAVQCASTRYVVALPCGLGAKAGGECCKWHHVHRADSP